MKEIMIVTSIIALTLNFIMLPLYLLTGWYVMSILNIFSSFLLWKTLSDLVFNKDNKPKDPLVDDECQ